VLAREARRAPAPLPLLDKDSGDARACRVAAAVGAAPR